MDTAADQTVVRMKDFRAGEVGKQVSDALGAIADQFTQGMQTWKSKAKAAARSTDGLVRSNPWQSVGTLALMGLAAGILVSRRARRSLPSEADGAAVSEMSGG